MRQPSRCKQRSVALRINNWLPYCSFGSRMTRFWQRLYSFVNSDEGLFGCTQLLPPQPERSPESTIDETMRRLDMQNLPVADG